MDTLPNPTMPLPASEVGVASHNQSNQSFIVANTKALEISELRDTHIIPVFPATNEPLISHYQLIESLADIALQEFPMDRILEPKVRVSHPIKGRIPEAKHKKASELEPWEETLYYERMMFTMEIPTITSEVAGNQLSLSIGAVKAYNLDNVYSKRTNMGQQFKLFIGFQNRVCTNLCVSTDGFLHETNISSISQLQHAIRHLIQRYRIDDDLNQLSSMDKVQLSETQFAQVMGRARMYKYLPEGEKSGIQPMLMGDQQLGMVVRNYYEDDNFSRREDGSISLWRMHNLLTGANKQTYIDQFLDRAVNATDFAVELTKDLTGNKQSWYLG
jgi:hypothetical protein